MTNSETINEIIIAYSCKQMFPIDLLTRTKVSARTYNYWFSFPARDFLQRLRDEYWSIGHEDLRFDANITGYIGYVLCEHFDGKRTYASASTAITHMVADYVSMTECFFDTLIPSSLQTGTICRHLQ